MQPGIRAGWRRALVARGRDMTDESAVRSALVLAPHPDDETIGCGATIRRKRDAGTRVTVVVATDGSGSHPSSAISPEELAELRAGEALAAAQVLGVGPDDVIQLGYADGQLSTRADDVRADLARVIRDVAPREILVASGLDSHPDHKALSRAVRRLVDEGGVDARVWEYPVWYWANGPWASGRADLLTTSLRFVADPVRSLVRLRPDLVATGPYLGPKRDALACYRSQTASLTGDPGWETLDAAFLEWFLGPWEVFLPLGGGRH